VEGEEGRGRRVVGGGVVGVSRDGNEYWGKAGDSGGGGGSE